VNRSGTNSKNCDNCKQLDEMSNYPQLILPTREDMIVKIKKHEKIPTLGEILEMRIQARDNCEQLGNGSHLEKTSA